MIDPWLIFHAAGISASGLLAYGTFTPSSQLWGRVIVRGSATERPAVALTFDDGPTAGPTERVLDLLRESGVPAAFFVVGRNCRRWPGLVRRMHDEGHVVANHTWDHSHAGWMGLRTYWDDQLRRTSDEVAQIIGRRPALFRPPMGIKTAFTLRAARRAGCRTVGWTRRARDGVSTTPAAILARFGAAAAGDILLLHDGVEPNSPGRDPEPTIAALPTLIGELRGLGLELARLDKLLGVGAYLERA